MEGISILENETRADVPVPDGLKNMLIQLKEGNQRAGIIILFFFY
ncbi:phage holin family protein [Clostridium botulinum]|nr:phage holin family protein [Clostridium botulinum]